jgi:protein gp37
MTGIKWTDRTHNCVHGCSIASEGCANCYSLTRTYYLEHGGDPRWPNAPTPFAGQNLTYLASDGTSRWTGRVIPAMHRIDEPLSVKKPLLWFANSMYDFFHENMEEQWINQILDVYRRAHWHQFQILTKRSERMLELDSRIDWPDNVCLVVSIESDKYVYRADHLRQTSVMKKGLSLEPLIKGVPSLSTDGIDWLIVGGESGTNYRPMKIEWVEEIAEKCAASGTALFVKQDSAKRDGVKGRFKDYPHLWEQKHFPVPSADDDQLRKFYAETEGVARSVRCGEDNE